MIEREGGDQEWRRHVRAFRRAADALFDPVPDLTGSLLAADNFYGLDVSLALLDVGLFDALPDGPVAGREAVTGDAQRLGRNWPLVRAGPTNAAGQPAMSGRPAAPDRNAPLQSVAPSASGTPASAPPVFSFRRRASKGSTPLNASSASRGKSGATMPSRSAEEAVPQPAAEKERLRSVPPHVQEVADEASQASVPLGDVTPTSSAGPVSSDPMALLDGLADSVLGQEGERVASEASGEPYLPSEALGTEVVRASPHVMAPTELPRKVPERSLPPSGVTERQVTVRLEEAMLAIGKLADGIIAAGGEALRLRGVQAAAPQEEHRGAGAGPLSLPPLLDSVDAAPWPEFSAPRKTALAEYGRRETQEGVNRPSEPDALTLGGQQIDADTLASLVNDVLVEDARRHGVDLS